MMPHYYTQRGATLIVVMFVLILITIVGAMAIRVAMTTLNISTNAQIGQLLSQTADTPLNQLAVSDLTSIADLSGAIGLAIEESKKSPGKEFVFCYRPTGTEKFAASLNVTMLVPPARTADADTKATIDEGGGAGLCDLTADFGSARRAVITQVAVKIPTDPVANTAPGAMLGRGTNLSGGTIMPTNLVEQQRIRITTTAISPAFARGDVAAIQTDCIGQNTTSGYINDNTDTDVAGKRTVAQCLADYGVPVISQSQEFNLQTLFRQVTAP